jgi:D-3-phosphoglycerate dehydrogenase
MSRKVLVTDFVFGDLESERSILEPLDAELVEAPGTDEAQLVEAVQGAEAMLVCYAKVTRRVVEAAAENGCRVIARYGIGYDNVDVEAATRSGMVVTNVPDYCLDEVADHTMALLLGLARGVVASARETAAGGWSVPKDGIHRLRGRRLALVGLGGIGRRVAVRAHAFGLEVCAYDPYVEPWDVDHVTRAATVEEAVADADFVSLHVPLTAETRGMIDSETIATMRRAPVLVNTARGPLVSLDAVVEALDDGRLSGVALDTAEVEPLPVDHPLRTHPRAVITPHTGFFSVEAQQELQRRAAEEVARALRKEAPDRPVNPAVLEAGRV